VSRRLRIASLCFPAVGGSGRIAALTAHALAERGHEVHVVSTGRPLALPDSTSVRLHEVEVPSYPALSHPPYSLALASALMRIERSSGLDVIHAHYAVPHAAVAFLAQAASPAPAPAVITTLHGTDVTQLGREPSHLPITRFCVGAADAVTVPSAALAREARAHLELGDALAIELIPNFVDSGAFRPATPPDPAVFDSFFEAGFRGGPVVVHVSNLRPVKRVADAIATLAAAKPDATPDSRPPRLAIVGDGPDRRALEARARAEGVADRVAFLGERHDVAELVRNADLFLLTSESESFGLAALEALASGVPVVATRAGGIVDVVQHEVTGLLAPVGDVAALARHVTMLLSDELLRARFAARAVADARARFRPEPIVDRYEALHQRVAPSMRARVGS